MRKIDMTSLSTGFAMFSMFFGAGNIAFPLMVGRAMEGHLLFALFGLLLTSVCIPFSGLLSITLFAGNYRAFFRRIGAIPGFLTIALLLSMIGPFGGIPRCVTLTFSTLKIYLPQLQLFPFTLVSCALIFLFCWKKSRILDIIGYCLSPLLILFLSIIIIKGIFFDAPLKMALPLDSGDSPFLYGLKEGYNTMDLLAAFFFASFVYQRLRWKMGEGAHTLFTSILKASFIGMALLSSIYIGFSYVSANHSMALSDVPIDQLLGQVGHLILGVKAGFVVSMTVALTCLTTAIALTAVCAEFLRKEVGKKGKMNHETALLIVLAITALISSLEFQGIVKMLAPVLKLLYPSLLLLSICNIFYKLYHFRPVKAPVFITLFIIAFFQNII